MSRSFRRVLILVLIVLVPVTGFVLWRRASGPAPPVVERPEELDPLVRRLVDERVATVRSRPRDPVTWVDLGAAYQAHRLSEPAEQCYRQALSLDDADAASWYHLARVRARQGDFEDAVACVDHAITIESSYAPLHWQRGDWLLELGRLDDAEASFRRVVEVNPDESAGVHGVARVHLQRQRYQAAIDLLGPVVALHEGDAYGRHLLSRAYRGLGRAEEADRFAESSEVAPPLRYDPWAWLVANLRTGYAPELTRAEALVRSGRGPDAIAVVEDVIATYGADPRALNGLAGAYAASGRPVDAIRTLRELLQQEPTHYRAHLNLASVYEQTGNDDAALATVRAAIELTPRPEAYVQEGKLLLTKRDFDGAATAFAHAVELGADSAENRVALANILDQAGRPDEAIALYHEVIAARPDLAIAHAGLAVALAGRSEFHDARRAIDQARTLAPGDVQVESAARRVDELERAGG